MDDPRKSSQPPDGAAANAWAPLTAREAEIVDLLLGGGRIATISRELSVSDHTVRNHLKAIFWKYDVHSQAELIEKARRHRDLAEPDAGERLGAARLRRNSLFAEIERIAAEDPGVAGVKRAMRAALPLDEERRAQWRQRFELWNADEEEALSSQDRDERRERWGAQTLRLFVDTDGRSALRGSLDPVEFTRSLSTLLIGAAMRIVRDSDPETVEREMRLLDEFIDAGCAPPSSRGQSA